MIATALFTASNPGSADPYIWLEDTTAPKALEWVKAHNQRTELKLNAHPLFKTFESQAREILLSDDRLPLPQIEGNFVYNFWQDKSHVRGLFRRTTAASYQETEPQWETVIDLDDLAKQENENWVWHGVSFSAEETSSCLVRLSRGGTDADVVREFDLERKSFIDNGFSLPEAKSDISWLTKDSVLVGTDFSEGSLTKSGYPRIAKLWKRGSDLSTATTLLEGELDDVAVGSKTYEHKGTSYSFISRSLDFYNTEYHLVNADGELTRIPVPTHAELRDVFNGSGLFSLQKDWETHGTVFKAGSLLAISLADVNSTPTTLFEPTATETLEDVAVTANHILLHTLNNVRGRIDLLQLGSDNELTRTAVPVASNGSVAIVSSDPDSDRFYVRFEDYLTPQTLFEGTIREGKAELKKIKELAPKFSVEGLEVQQWSAVSADGTTVPYFIIKKKDLKLDGTAPTILYGYGGFQAALTPAYAPVTGKLWLERGNVYVVANIRGGGEFGPKWHQAALKENRQKAFDDFKAIARDLIAKKVTSPQHLGIMGGSNGGLLMGVMFTQAPELFKAVVCQVPLLDMLRFHRLLAGHSWTGEYGNPDIEAEAAYISRYSPYQNVQKDKKYPNIFFVTSSKDDRVHPGHARKMAAKLDELGYPFEYYENIEGGHGAAANIEQRIYRTTLEYVYLTDQLED